MFKDREVLLWDLIIISHSPCCQCAILFSSLPFPGDRTKTDLRFRTLWFSWWFGWLVSSHFSPQAIQIRVYFAIWYESFGDMAFDSGRFSSFKKLFLVCHLWDQVQNWWSSVILLLSLILGLLSLLLFDWLFKEKAGETVTNRSFHDQLFDARSRRGRLLSHVQGWRSQCQRRNY